ncbi:DUF2752 domain-containing protein [Streptomyces sp. NPDC048279]|uniref:DUF2752 domain-containing protein n=1 Tax=Streptomyces sp. NPDC048279 TaxID=3154714 RepID=UPI00341D9605
MHHGYVQQQHHLHEADDAERPPSAGIRLGELRSAHAFVHGDLLAALRDNAAGVAAYLAFAVVWTVWVVRAVRGRPVRIELTPVPMWTLGALLLVFTVVRNLPVGGWLHP